MAINVSGGMANANKNRKARSSALLRKVRQRKGLNDDNNLTQDIDIFVDSVEEEEMYEQTKLGKLLEFIDPFIIVLIILNAIQMGLATFDFVSKNTSLSDIFELADKVFLIIFTVEISLGVIHHLRLDRVMLEDAHISFEKITTTEREEQIEDRGWIIFDLLVVIMSWSLAGVSVIRAFRILRVLRLVKRIENLKNVVGALIDIMPKMGVISFFLIIMFLIFGIGFTQLFQNLHVQHNTTYDYFGNLALTWVTLFQIMTFDNWQSVAREVMDIYPWSWIPFLIFTVITGFVIMNLIIAIICESLVKLTEKKKAEREKKEAAEARLAEKAAGVDSLLISQKSLGDASSVHTIDNMWRIEDMLDEILEDQDMLLQTVEKLKDVLQDVLLTTDKKKANEIRSVLLSFPQSIRKS